MNTGRFESKSNFVPLAGATPAGEDVQLAFPEDAVKDAPGIEPEGELSQQEEKTTLRADGDRDDLGAARRRVPLFIAGLVAR